MKKLFLIFSLLSILACKNKIAINHSNPKYSVSLKEYVDSTRNRNIPIAIFLPKNKNLENKIPIIFSHGYGQNKGGDYLVYSYLTEFLAEKGYFVMSIQHELPTDELLPMEGNLQITRRPNWERGSQNILFTLNEMKKNFPDLNYKKLIVIGHSNGGDMTVLFAHQHPELIDKVISLDNRRMEIPRISKPKIYTLRSKDYPADEGVLPTEDEQKKFGITVEFTAINHSSMDNDANEEERKYLTSKILNYLNEK